MIQSGRNPSNPMALKVLSFAIAAALATQVQAQVDQADKNSNQLEEIVVTASKRETTLQDLSMSVTALNPEMLSRAEILDVTRLDTLVPGMHFASSGNEVRIALRGTRQNNVGTEAEQSVGIFEDGVYVPTSTQAFGSYVDVQRIEVLRGPQGTLYGRNTFGGTINIITNDPNFDGLHGTVSGLYGAYDRYRFEAVANIPLSETFAVRVAGMLDNHDGYIENTWVPGPSDDLNDRDLSFFRIGAKWLATDHFTAKLKITSNDSANNGSAIWGYQQIGGYRGLEGTYVSGHPNPPANASCCFDQGPWKIARDQRSNAETDNMAYTLNLDWDFPEFATLKLVGNYTNFDGWQNYDSDYSDGGDPLNNGFTGWISSQETWSTEVQLVSNTDGPVDWLLGFYYYEQTANWNWQDLNNGVFETPHWDNQGDFLSDSLGVFGHATWNLTEQVRLVGGLRYAEDSKTEKDILDWNVWPPVTVPNSGRSDSWDQMLWKIGGEYDISEDAMTYLTASTGYRAGGFNIDQEGVPPIYDPEEVTAYELGLKNTLLDGAMTLNIAAYYNDYTNMQAQSFKAFEGDDAVLEFTENGGELDSKGVEIELNWVPASDPNLNVSAQVSWMDAEFGDYNISRILGLGNLDGRQDVSDNPTTQNLSLKGWEPAMSPGFTFGTQVSYTFQYSNGAVLTPYVQAYYSGSYYGYDVNLPGNRQDAYTTWDLRLMWDSPTGTWAANAFVLNALEEEVFNRALIFQPRANVHEAWIQTNWANPRTWGVQVRYNF